jgi:hypothetical protein
MLSRLFRCRECGSFKGYDSRPRSRVERYILPWLLLRPVRCGGCLRRSLQARFVLVQGRRQSKSGQTVTA